MFLFLHQKPVKVNKRGIPLDVLRDKKSEGESKASTEHSEPITVTPSVIRHKGETREEKQARKHLVKQHNKVAVIMLCIIQCNLCTYIIV